MNRHKSAMATLWLDVAWGGPTRHHVIGGYGGCCGWRARWRHSVDRNNQRRYLSWLQNLNWRVMMIIDLEITSQVDRMFREIGGRVGEIVLNPVTGSSWVKGIDPIGPQKAAYRVLQARKWFADTGPPDAPPLPVSYGERESLKKGGLPHIVAWYARSLDALDYDFDGHPPFEDYARGVMASPLAPDFITQDADLLRRFPPRRLDGLGPGLVWRPD